MSLERLKRMSIDRRSGYSLTDIALAVRLMGKGPTGRFSLMRELGLGEATAKTMMKKLEDEGIAENSARGQVLTRTGNVILGLMWKKILEPVEVAVPGISKKPSIAFIVRGARGAIRKGIEQRDEGIKHGVDVTTLVFEDGKIRFPEARNVVEIRELAGSLVEGDVILVSSGNNLFEAKKGGFAVGLGLI